MNPKQVVVHIVGGLGNQFFQYAAGRSLSDRLGCDLVLDLRGLHEIGDRKYRLEKYKIRAIVGSQEYLKKYPYWRSTRYSRFREKMSRTFPHFLHYPLFRAENFSYDDRFENIKTPVYLMGYWQSEKYFSWNRNKIIDDLVLLNNNCEKSDLYNKISSSNSVALHIRRGDYVSNPAAAAFHGLCSLSYYQSALNILQNRIKNMEIFIFTDDSEWVKENLIIKYPSHIVESVGDDSDLLDFELMRQCKHHIIANSSFSWWGAWSCKSEDKQIIAPKRWFLDKTWNTSDLVPDSWLLVD